MRTCQSHEDEAKEASRKQEEETPPPPRGQR